MTKVTILPRSGLLIWNILQNLDAFLFLLSPACFVLLELISLRTTRSYCVCFDFRIFCTSVYVEITNLEEIGEEMTALPTLSMDKLGNKVPFIWANEAPSGPFFLSYDPLFDQFQSKVVSFFSEERSHFALRHMHCFKQVSLHLKFHLNI